MKRIIYLNESDLYRVSKRVIEEQELEQELDEIIRFNTPVGSQLGNMYQGIKGFIKGESYGYFNYLSKIKNRSKRVMNELEHIETFVKYLMDLKPKIEKLKIAPEKKLRLLNLLDSVVNKWQPFFPEFSSSIEEINKLSSEKLSGERLDVIPGSDSNQLGGDLMKSKDSFEKPKLTDFNPNVSNSEKKTEPTSSLTTQGSIESPTIDKKEQQKKESEELLKKLQGDTLSEEIQRFKELIK